MAETKWRRENGGISAAQWTGLMGARTNLFKMDKMVFRERGIGFSKSGN